MMKKILLVLAMLAGTVFLGQPAVAAEGDGATEQVATSPQVEADPAPEEPAEEPPPPAAEEPVAEEPVAEEPAAQEPAVEEAAAEEPAAQEPAVNEGKDVAEAPVVVAAAPVKIKICHATASQNNPYVENSPNQSADLNGHSGHTGPVFVANGPAGWGDIIPPFTFNGVDYPGLNWSIAGQAIYNNGCAPVGQPPVVLIEATAVAPTVTPPTCVADGALVLPQTTGVIYGNDPAGTGPGTHTVTASAEVGYVLTNPNFESVVEVLPQLTGPQCVVNGLLPATAELPTLTDATCSADGSFSLADTPNVIYIDLNFGNFHLVTAIPAPGYYLTNPTLLILKLFVVDDELTGAQCDTVDLTICHRTNSNVNPYVSIGPATAGVANGHDTEHEGPVWDPTLKAQGIEWGDIIPPYTYDDVDYPGQNWDAVGQAIYANGCEPTEGLSQFAVPQVTTVEVCDGGDQPTPTPVAGVSYEYTVGDGLTGPWEITATALEGFEFADDTQTVFQGDAGDESACVTPAVVTTETCDGADAPAPTVVEGVVYDYTVGDGLSGLWEITASVLPGFFFADDVQTVFNGDAGDPTSVECTGSGGGGDDPGEGGIVPGDDGDDDTPGASPALAAGFLPDTGGVPLWLLLLGGSMSAAGIIILMNRRPVVHAFTSGAGPTYSLTLPPRTTAVASTVVVGDGALRGLRRVVAAVSNGLRRLLGGRD